MRHFDTLEAVEQSATTAGGHRERYAIDVLLAKINDCYAERISQQSDKLKLLLSCDTLEDTEDWYDQIVDGVKKANNEKKAMQRMEQQGGICQEISDLVVYCKAVKTMTIDPDRKL